MRSVIAAAVLALATAPAFAAEPAPAFAGAQAIPGRPDAARLAAARQTVDYVFPAGTYARMMNGTMDKMMDSIMDSTMKMPLSDLAGIAGIDTEKLGSASLAEIMDIYDPAYKERMRVSTRTMMSEMMGLMTQFEPDIRDGLATAYALRFDELQLNDLNAFFATPTGRAYAADSYLVMMSPEVMNKMQVLMPKLMQAMPAIIDKVKIATAQMPPPRGWADLPDADRTRLAKILGISRKELDRSEAARAEGK